MEKTELTGDSSVLSVPFSGRARKVLSTLLMGLPEPIKYGYATLGDICKLGYLKVKNAKECGATTFKEIESKLAKHGMSLVKEAKVKKEVKEPILHFIPRIAPPDSDTVINELGGKQAALEYRCDLLPAQAILAISELLKDGAEKDGEWNWRLIPIKDHINHALVHLFAHNAGDGCDDHLLHAATRLLFAMDMKVVEDRKKALD